MKTKESKIFNQLVVLSVSLGQQQDPKRLEIYVENLKRFELEPLLRQIESFSRSAKYFPQLVEIIGPLTGLDVPTDELATIIASEIIECISRFGPYQTNEVRTYLGDKFQIAQRIGGWQALCQISYDEIPTTRAQLRELAKAYINRSKREMSEDFSGNFRLNTEAQFIENKTSKETGLQLLKF